MPGTADASPLLRFTTRTCPPSARRRSLHELAEQGLLPVRPLTGRPLHVDLVKARLPGASVLAGTFAGVRQVGDLGPSGAAEDLFFGVNLSGRSLAVCPGHEVWVGPGDAVAIASDVGAFSVERAAPAQMIGIRIPRRSVPVSAALPTAGPLRLVPARTPALRLLTAYV